MCAMVCRCAPASRTSAARVYRLLSRILPGGGTFPAQGRQPRRPLKILPRVAPAPPRHARGPSWRASRPLPDECVFPRGAHIRLRQYPLRRAECAAPARASSSTATMSAIPAACSRRVSSTMTMASAPGGMGAPVMILHAVPAATVTSGIWPAATSPISARSTGAPGDAPRVSSARTA